MQATARTAILATALAGASGCGAEPGVTGPAPDEPNDIGQTTQELRNGIQAFVRVSPLGNQLAGRTASTVPGGAITSFRLIKGHYTVRLANHGDATGNVQIVALGSDNTRCNAMDWSLESSAVHIDVECYAPNTNSEVFVDSGFVVRYAKAASNPPFGTGAYLRVSNTLTVTKSWNSTGGTNTVERVPNAPGQFIVTLPGLALLGGTVQVSATGVFHDQCKVAGWFPSGSDQRIFVRCFGNLGGAVNSAFSLNYIGSANSVGLRERGAYVWANEPTTPIYAPSAFYSRNTGNSPGLCSWTNIASQFADKTYSIRHDNLGGTGGTPHVTAYGTDATYCKLRDVTDSGSVVDVNTRCFTSAGAPADSMYVETFSTKLSVGPC